MEAYRAQQQIIHHQQMTPAQQILAQQHFVNTTQTVPLQQQIIQIPRVISFQENASVIFSLNGLQTRVQCNVTEKMLNIVNAFIKKSKLDINNTQFLYGGNKVNFGLTFYEQASKLDKERKEMNVLVYTNETVVSINKGMVKSKEIICPKCKENCLISFENYQIKLYNCKNGHYFNNISLKEFNNLQNINENEIRCKNCNNTKSNSYNKQFYKCLNCRINLCPLCKQNHNKNHETLDYDKINYICLNHKDFFVSYCKDCKLNLCMKCEMKHNNNHSIINYKAILPDDDEIKKELNQFKNKIDKLKENICTMINILNNVYDNLKYFHTIFYDIIYNYNFRQRNYEILNNVNSVQNFFNLKDIDDIINKRNFYQYKFSKIYELWNRMNVAHEKETQQNSIGRNSNNIKLLFSYNYHKEEIQAKSDEYFDEVALRYKNIKKIPVRNCPRFYFNSKELFPNSAKTLEEYGIKDGSLIDVIDNNAEIDKQKTNMTIVFSYSGKITTINATQDMILAEVYLKFYDTLHCKKIFYYNSIEVGPKYYCKTLDELGLRHFQTFDVIDGNYFHIH